MKKILCIIAVAIIGLSSVVAQQTVTLTFTGQDQNNAYVRLDHVTIENLTRNWSETVWFPDTVYTLTVGTGVEEYYLNGGMQVMPNPFNGRTLVNVHSVKDEKAVITMININGKKCAEYNGVLSEGDNYFEIQLTTPQTYILSVQTNEGLQCVKMVNTGRAAGNRIEPLGGGIHPAVVSLKSTTAHSFELGDEMRFQGYTLYFDSLLTSAPVTQSQSMDEEITLVFDIPNLTNLNSCEVTLMMQNETGFGNRITQIYDHEGNSYQVVQIGNQCWMKENLRTTHYSDGTAIPAGSLTSSSSPYYYDYSSSSLTLTERGYLYNWAAVMHGASSSSAIPSGVQGICPTGWHVPSDAEWTRLTDYVSSQSEYYVCDDTSYIAKALASTNGWWNDGGLAPCYPFDQSIIANNATGFGAMPAGYWSGIDGCNWAGIQGNFWSATENYHAQTWSKAWVRSLSYTYATVNRSGASDDSGLSVRCLRDGGLTVTEPTVTTDSATNVTESSAMLHGNISNPDDVAITSQGFEWKATEGGTYTQVTASGAAMTYALTGLTANTSYTYKAFVSFGETTTFGEELTFTTLATVTNPTITTDSASNVTETSAMLHGSISNPDNVAITSQGFEWKTTEGGTYTQVTASGAAMTYALTGLTDNTSYTYRAFVSYGGTTAYGGELTFTTLAAAVPVDGQPCPGAPTLTDVDSNVYNTVQIGNQCWMKENLRTTHYSNGMAIPAGSIASSSSPYYYDYNSSSLPLTERGYLYNWPAVMHGANSSQANPSGVQGICPTGWHVPSDAEWTQLTNYVSSQSDYVCGSVTSRIAKALAGTTGWTSSSTSCAVGNNQSSNNTTGFSALPAGYFSGIGGGGVCYTGTRANFWSTTQFDYNNISFLNMQHNSGYLDYGCYSAGFGCSVRCLRD